MDRLLLNPWVSRAGNAAFLVGVVLLVVRLVSGWDPLTLVTVILFAVGVVLMAVPYVERWRQRGDMSARIRREGKAALKRKRAWLESISQREGCPRNPERVEAYMQTRPDGIEVETLHCLDCGAMAYRHGDEPTQPPEHSEAHSAPASPTRSDVEMQAATRAVQDELLSIRRAVDDATEERVPPRQLQDAEWRRLRDVFSDYGYAFRDHVRRACRNAYIAAGRINDRAETWNAPLGDEELGELRELRELVTKAIRTMNAVLGSWGPSVVAAPDALDEWLLEHRKKGLDINHRLKGWLSRKSSGSVARWAWWTMAGEEDVLVDWVRDLHHRIDRDRPSDLPRFQSDDDRNVIVYKKENPDADAGAKARAFARNLEELTSLLTERGVL